MNIRKSIVMSMAALAVLALVIPAIAASPAPRLILQITVDQLRGDLPSRYADRLTKAHGKHQT